MVQINWNVSLNRLEGLVEKTMLNNLDYFSDTNYQKERDLDTLKKKYFRQNNRKKYSI